MTPRLPGLFANDGYRFVFAAAACSKTVDPAELPLLFSEIRFNRLSSGSGAGVAPLENVLPGVTFL